MRQLKRGVWLIAAVSTAATWAEAADPLPSHAPTGPAAEAAARTTTAEAPVLSLTQAVQWTLERHPRLRLSRATTEASEARVDRAFAPLLPQVTGSARYQRATANGAQGAPARASSFRSYDSFTFELAASQLVTDFGQTTGRLRVARATRDAQKKLSEADRLELLLAVKTSFLQAQAQKQLLAVALETLANLQRHLASVSGFVEVGTRPPIDRVQAQADVQRAELVRVNALNNYAIAKARLAQAMGFDAHSEFEVAGELLPPIQDEEAATERLFAIALAARPDLQAAQDTLYAQQLSVDVARAGYFPSLSVSAALRETGDAPTTLRWNASVGAALIWPLYEGGATRAEVREAHANVDAATAQLALARQQLLVDLEQARLSVHGAKQALATADLLVESTRQRLILAEGRYQTGVGNLLELADAQLALTTAQGDRVQAEFSLSTARAALLQALGRP